MAQKEQVSIEYIAELASLRSELAKLPGISEAEAKKMVAALDREIRKATAASVKAAEKANAAWKGTGKTFDGIRQLASGVGGPVGEAAGRLEQLTGAAGSLGGVLTSFPAMAGAGAGAILAVGAAGLKAASDVQELLDELDELHRAPIVDDVQRDAVTAAGMAVNELWASTKELAALVGVLFTPALWASAKALDAVVDVNKAAVEGWNDGLRWLGLVSDQLEVTKGDIEDLTRTYNDLVELTHGPQIAAPEARRVDVSALKAQQAAIEALEKMTRQLATARLEDEDALIAKYEDTIAEIEKQSAAAGRSAVAWEAANAAKLAATEDLQAGLEKLARTQAAELARTQAEAASELGEIWEAAYASQLTGEQEIRHAFDLRLAKIRELAAQSGDFALAERARLETEKIMYKELADLAAEQAEQRKQQEEEEFAAFKARATAGMQSSADIAESIRMLAEVALEADGEMTESQKRAAMIAYKAQRAAALVQIAMSTAVGIARSLELGPYAAAAGIAFATATGAAQTAAVLTTDPPEFPFGGIVGEPARLSPDHSLVGVQEGESVLNRSATSALGRDGVDALNSGRGLGPVQVNMVYRHRIFDTFVMDNMAKGGPLTDAMQRIAGRRPGQRRRRQN